MLYNLVPLSLLVVLVLWFFAMHVYVCVCVSYDPFSCIMSLYDSLIGMSRF